MSAGHTMGRLATNVIRLTTEGQQKTLASMSIYPQDKEDARRLAACWNACDGIPTEALEAEGSAVMGWTRTASKLLHAMTQRDELLSALQTLVQQVESGYFDYIATDHPDSAVITARAAIAKATGVQP
jgi:hypothetical protein